MKGKLKSAVLLAAMALMLGATWADLPLEFHVKRADAIAKVLIVSRTSFFKTPNEIVTQWEALTDCGVGVLKDRHKPGDPPLKQCSTIIIETWGGVVGGDMMVDTSEPAFKEGQSYWILLVREQPGIYRTVDGALNSYRVNGPEFETINPRVRGMSEISFTSEIADIVKRHGNGGGK